MSLKMFCQYVVLPILVLGLAPNALSQGCKRIAVVDVKRFEFEIKEFEPALELLDKEFKDKNELLTSKVRAYNALGKELQTRTGEGIIDYSPRIEKYKALATEIKLLLADTKPLVDARHDALTEPIHERIKLGLIYFAKLRGFDLILEKDSVKKTVDDAISIPEITDEFIKFYNEEYPKKK